MKNRPIGVTVQGYYGRPLDRIPVQHCVLIPATTLGTMKDIKPDSFTTPFLPLQMDSPNRTARITRFIALFFLPVVAVAWFAEIIIILQDAINGRFYSFPVLVWIFTGVVTFLLVSLVKSGKGHHGDRS